jgi:hypothetical protein
MFETTSGFVYLALILLASLVLWRETKIKQKADWLRQQAEASAKKVLPEFGKDLLAAMLGMVNGESPAAIGRLLPQGTIALVVEDTKGMLSISVFGRDWMRRGMVSVNRDHPASRRLRNLGASRFTKKWGGWVWTRESSVSEALVRSISV